MKAVLITVDKAYVLVAMKLGTYDNIRLPHTRGFPTYCIPYFLFSFLMYKMLSCVFFGVYCQFLSRVKSVWEVESIIVMKRVMSTNQFCRPSIASRMPISRRKDRRLHV